jgi:hypothetical protein
VFVSEHDGGAFVFGVGAGVQGPFFTRHDVERVNPRQKNSGVFMLITLGTAVPEAEDDARGYEMKQWQGVAASECFNGVFSRNFLIRGADTEIGNAMRQCEQIGVRLIRKFAFSWNLGLGLRHEPAQIRVVTEGNLGAVGVRLRRVHRAVPGTLDVTGNTLGAVFGRLLAQHLAPFDAVELVNRRSVCTLSRVRRRKDWKRLASGGLQRFSDSDYGGQVCCGAGFADIHAEQGVEVVVGDLDLFGHRVVVLAHGVDG